MLHFLLTFIAMFLPSLLFGSCCWHTGKWIGEMKLTERVTLSQSTVSLVCLVLLLLSIICLSFCLFSFSFNSDNKTVTLYIHQPATTTTSAVTHKVPSLVDSLTSCATMPPKQSGGTHTHSQPQEDKLHSLLLISSACSSRGKCLIN